MSIAPPTPAPRSMSCFTIRHMSSVRPSVCFAIDSDPSNIRIRISKSGLAISTTYLNRLGRDRSAGSTRSMSFAVRKKARCSGVENTPSKTFSSVSNVKLHFGSRIFRLSK